MKPLSDSTAELCISTDRHMRMDMDHQLTEGVLLAVPLHHSTHGRALQAHKGRVPCCICLVAALVRPTADIAIFADRSHEASILVRGFLTCGLE